MSPEMVWKRALAACACATVAFLLPNAGATAWAATPSTPAPAVSGLPTSVGITPRGDVPVPTKKQCIARGLRLAEPLFDSIAVRSSNTTKRWRQTLRYIKVTSPVCRSELFGNGTITDPDGGLLAGNGFSFTRDTCPDTRACRGGDAGPLAGNGGNGHNGGAGGNAGWYSGRAGNGGNGSSATIRLGGSARNLSCATCAGGDGGRAGRYGTGGRGGSGAAGAPGGAGGTGGLLDGAGGGGGAGGA